LATNALTLIALKHRTAAATAHTILYEIVVRKGCPKLIHSDAAQEFISKAMKSLTSIIGCAQTTTKGHNPQANSTIERVWAFVGTSLRQMTKEQYENFHLYMPIIASVWNSLPNSTTGISPFELEHGMKPRTISDSMVEEPQTEGTPATADDLASIATSAKAFQRIAVQATALNKVLLAQKLIERGRPKHTYKVGDKVTFFRPPSEAEAKIAGRKPKHLMQQHGPAVITKELSSNHTTFRLQYKGRTYERHVINMTPYTASGTPKLFELTLDTTITQGSFVAVLDDDEDKSYHVAEVLSVVNEQVNVHYWGTTTKKLETAKWGPLWTIPGTNRVTRNKPSATNTEERRCTGSFSINKDQGILVILPNLGMTPGHRISASCRKILKEKGFQHHRTGVKSQTWQLTRRLITPHGTVTTVTLSMNRKRKRSKRKRAGYAKRSY